MSDISKDWDASSILTSRGPVDLPKDAGRDAIAALIIDLLLAVHRKAGRFHAPSILTEIGALAGFAAQMGLRKGVIEPQRLDPRQILVGVATKSGETFYFSDAMNWILFERMDDPPYSIWGYVAGVVRDPEKLPDVIEIVRDTARTVGTREFGMQRIARENMSHRPPRLMLSDNWHSVHECLTRAGRPPMEWPYDLARAAQQLMRMSDGMLALPLAAKLIMGAAIPMAKVDPRSVPGT